MTLSAPCMSTTDQDGEEYDFFPQELRWRTRTCVFGEGLISYYLVYSFLYCTSTLLTFPLLWHLIAGFLSFAVFFFSMFSFYVFQNCIQSLEVTPQSTLHIYIHILGTKNILA